MQRSIIKLWPGVIRHTSPGPSKQKICRQKKVRLHTWGPAGFRHAEGEVGVEAGAPVGVVRSSVTAAPVRAYVSAVLPEGNTMSI